MPACHAGDRRFESGRVRHPAYPYAPSARPDGAFLCPLVASAPVPTACHTPPSISVLGLAARARPRRRRSPSSPRCGRALVRQSDAVCLAAPRLDRATAVPTAARPPPAAPAGAGATPTPTAPPRPEPIERRRDRAGHPLPVDRDRDDPREVDGRPRRDEQALRRRSSWSPPRPTRSSPRSASSARPTPTRLVQRRSRDALSTDLAAHRKRLAFLRADAVGAGRPGAGLGRPRACSASTGVATSATGRSRPAAGAPPATGVRPGGDVDAVRRRRHHARPRRATRRSGSRARARTSRSTAGRPRSPAAARTARRSAGTCRTPSGPATRARCAT